MKERPILFSAPMVRALLAGTKTQTRRVLKQATGPSLSVGIDDDAPGVAELSWLWGDGPGYDVHEAVKRIPCPYGQPGDRLWVREAFAFTDAHMPDYSCSIEYRADNKCLAIEAGRELVDVPHGCDPRPFAGPWSPSIHMPRWASRITLEITGVRVERLKAISEADAIAEGCTLNHNGYFLGGPHAVSGRKQMPTGQRAFRDLWESINGSESWDADPWVWVVEFRRLP